MNKFQLLYNAIQAGESLKNPETWKKRQVLFTAISTLLCLVPAFTKFELSQENIDTITYAIVGLTGCWNMYLTYATSTKVGINKE